MAIALLTAFSYSICTPQPRIEYIETYSTNQVLIHYSTPPNQGYVLQRINTLSSNGVILTNWTDMHTGAAVPFEWHWIIKDTRTNQSRFYRLRVAS